MRPLPTPTRLVRSPRLRACAASWVFAPSLLDKPMSGSSDGCSRCCAIVAPTARALPATVRLRLEPVGWRSSIRWVASSRSATKTIRWCSCATEKFTTIASCRWDCATAATSLQPTATSSRSSIFTRRKASTASIVCAACSPSRSGTGGGGDYYWRAIVWASSRSTTRVLQAAPVMRAWRSPRRSSRFFNVLESGPSSIPPVSSSISASSTCRLPEPCSRVFVRCLRGMCSYRRSMGMPSGVTGT